VSHEAFLHGLRAQPDDDNLRLVYADWLDEQDDPCGPFLRSVVALRAASATNERLTELRRRIHELRSAVSAGWLVEVERALAEDEVREAVFRDVFGARSPAPGAYLEVENRRDPSWYLLDRLAADYGNIQPGSAARTRDGFYIGEDGASGAMYSIDGLKWHGQERCDVDFGVVMGPLMGHGSLYRVELQNDRWVVTEAKGTWIS
jgi:uncharacterized protein (TIGR02996 family)